MWQGYRRLGSSLLLAAILAGAATTGCGWAYRGHDRESRERREREEQRQREERRQHDRDHDRQHDDHDRR
jgi:hypothetical protein